MLAKTAWAFAKMEVRNAALMEALARRGTALRSRTEDPLVEFLGRMDVEALLEMSTQEEETFCG